jgi:hypothetical protein
MRNTAVCMQPERIDRRDYQDSGRRTGSERRHGGSCDYGLASTHTEGLKVTAHKADYPDRKPYRLRESPGR